MTYEALVKAIKQVPKTQIPGLLHHIVVRAEKENVFVSSGAEPTRSTHGLVKFVTEVIKYHT